MKGTKQLGIVLIFIALLMVIRPETVHAEIADESVFEGSEWELLFEENLEEGLVQSVCVTEDYIVTLENKDDTVDTPDILRAYYRNNKDENGNKVEQYSLAKRIDSIHYEHCNGMTYNPKTKKILVSLYTAADPENRGCLYVLNSETFEYEDRIKIADDFNVLGIGYDEETDQYVIQTNDEGGYSFKILNSDFQITDDLGSFSHTSQGDNFQDLCVSGDYIVNFPLTAGMGIGSFINMYSISTRDIVSSTQLDFKFENITWDEPESICVVGPGKFLAAVNVVEDTQERKVRFYQTEVPYYQQLEVIQTVGGKEKKDIQKVLQGEKISIDYQEVKGQKISEVRVDGKAVEYNKKDKAFTFTKIEGSHSIEVIYKKVKYFRVTFFFLLVFAVGICAALLYRQHLKIQRAKKRKKAQRMRRQIQRNLYEE